MMLRTLMAFMAFYAFTTRAEADSFHAAPLKRGTAMPVQAYGQQNPACAEWTNGCVICTVTAGHAQCSTPGIACTPAGLTCRRKTTP
ncbi:hypothetical protein P7D22_07780 [Lichenihabitans sp. Uapishka_5]|uniref:hypothetical protein n=1 Tax=Lichenihabitans sp. Uapishka_5 TaxID=3037302 RepID=UPI0029E8122F|nr:hypothetical protein [Lichenihabitans sp. Uapishka_5]MDX7951078.1 hypothetical protein [Lichenihabitans sp. Uapishka_5]